MKDRIQKIISDKKITNSKFADIIGVQRSSISHLVAGRNQPSLDIVKRILLNFPDINPNWLLFGDGEMTASQSDTKESSKGEQTVDAIHQMDIDDVNESIPDPATIETSQDQQSRAKVSAKNIKVAAKSTRPASESVMQEPQPEQIAPLYNDSNPMANSQRNYNASQNYQSNNNGNNQFVNPGFGSMPIIVFNSNNTYSVFAPDGK